MDFYTICKGYEIELIITHVMAGDSDEEEAAVIPVSEEEIKMAVQFLSDLDFIPAAVEAPAE